MQGVKRPIGSRLPRFQPLRARRRAAILGGTTTWGDCLVGLRHLLNRPHLVRGPAIARYEQAFAERIGVRYGYSFQYGRVGLYGILRALEVGSGDEVLLQVPTHIVVPNSIRYTGAKPVYVDCERQTFNMDLREAEQRITPRTKAIVLQHTFGIPADIDAALDLARRYDLFLIEDCVHALGATFDGRPVGSFGHAAFFSTEETKTISTTMGGVAVTDDPKVADQLRAFQDGCLWPPTGLTARYVLKLLSYHLLTAPPVFRYAHAAYALSGRRNPLPGAMSDEEFRGERPANYEQRFSNVQAVLGLRQLQRLEQNVRHRREIAGIYRGRLLEYGLAVPHHPQKANPAYLRFPVWVADRAAVMRATAPYAVLGTWFTSVLEEAVSPAHGNYIMGACPQAEAAARHLVNLPTHPRVSRRDAESIIGAVIGASHRNPS